MNMEFSTIRYLLELSFSMYDGLICNPKELMCSLTLGLLGLMVSNEIHFRYQEG